MTTPLPQSLNTPTVGRLPTGAHAGLWFDKFCNQWSKTPWKIDSPAKLGWIKTVTDKPVGDIKLIDEHSSRLSNLANKLGGVANFFKTNGRFATGLGREHPIENGFVWHSALGVPFLPGSSVKGLVRAWANTWSDAEKPLVERIFGSTNSEHVGSVLFLGALPTKPVQLAADVMTPHYGPYYEDKSGNTPPADWHSPVPIPFLTVADGQSFVFALAPRTTADRTDSEQAARWLEDALRELGAGAKTAVGYGRFVPDVEAAETNKKEQETALKEKKEADEKAAFTASLANLSPIARELKEASHNGNWCSSSGAESFKADKAVERWLTKLEADPKPDAVAEIRRLIEIHFEGILSNPKKMRGKNKDEPVYKERWQKIAHRINALPKQ